MTIAELRNLCAAQPFRPFVIHLADGRQVPVAVILRCWPPHPVGEPSQCISPTIRWISSISISVTDLEIKSPNRRAGEKT